MKRLIVLASLVVSCMGVRGALADENWNPAGGNDPLLSEMFPQPTQEMWFYLQEIRRHDDPQQAVRRAAEFKAAQRRLRIESRKWFGYSASRPTASAVPTMTVHSPSWVGNTGDPYRWVGGGVIRVTNLIATDSSDVVRK